MSVNPFSYYDHKRQQYEAAVTSVSKTVKQFSRLRLLAILLMLVFGYLAILQEQQLYWGLAFLFFVAFIVLIRLHTGKEKALKLVQLRLSIVLQELAALSGDHSSFPDGNVFINPAHPFSYDLDIFGKGSIYQLLCRSITVNGAKKLAAIFMQKTAERAVILERQSRVKELSDNPDFLEDFRAVGMSAEEGALDYKMLGSWLSDNDDFVTSPLARIAGIVMPLASLVVIALAIAGQEVKTVLGVVVAINWLILKQFSQQIKKAAQQVGKTAALTEKYALLQAQLSGRQFSNEWLATTVRQSEESLQHIQQFNKLVHAFESRSNGMTGPIMNSLFLYDIFYLLRLENWRRKHKELLLANIEAIIEMDVLVSCAVYAYNHPEFCYPVFTEERVILAENIRHPLLAGHAVGNDCSIGRQEQLYLLTGANMTGKSTFIRTIGVSVLLSYLGVPVGASSFTLPLLDIYTSIRVTDSVQDDISYFRAELNRIKVLMGEVASSSSRYMVLLDEPLRGTNSADKQMGTRSIIEKLLLYDAIGIVATHDIGLSVLEQEHPAQVKNYHFESHVVQDELVFDFKLHAGCSTSNNATLLMKKMGIIDAQ